MKNMVQKGAINEAAIIVASPFQALCAIEAIKYFHIQEPRFFVYESENSLEKTHSFIVSQGFECEDLEDVSGTLNIIRTFKNHKKYKYILSGDFFSKYCFIISILWSKLGSTILYLDDGNSTLTLLPPLNKKRFRSGSLFQNLIYGVLLLYSKLKGLKDCFYTIYDVKGKGFPYCSIRNEFSSLLCGVNNVEAGIYIIGTNTSKIGMSRDTFCNYLMTIKRYSDEHFPNHKVYYCPHRSDLNYFDNECKTLGIELFNTVVSVEVDFVSKNINPITIFGFGSTALLTLKKIYRDTDIIDFIYHSPDKHAEMEYRQIEKVYEENGIRLIDLDV